MNEHPNGEKGTRVPVIVWLLCAFAPSVAGIGCLEIRAQGQWVFPFLLVLDTLCSLAAAFGLVSWVKDNGLKVLYGLLLAILLFFMNVVIVVFAGCSAIGRIAP
jgi:hypothetical protein